MVPEPNELPVTMIVPAFKVKPPVYVLSLHVPMLQVPAPSLMKPIPELDPAPESD
jgi:hypothetical protein